jgi:hypothetical protein
MRRSRWRCSNDEELRRIMEDNRDSLDPMLHPQVVMNIAHTNPIDGDSNNPPGDYMARYMRWTKGRGYVEYDYGENVEMMDEVLQYNYQYDSNRRLIKQGV